jgi:hypothetical protein
MPKKYIFFLESDIKRAMKCTQSNMAAARYLGINYLTYKKYAKMYFDENGVSLFDLHLNQSGKGVVKPWMSGGSHNKTFPIHGILNNQFPKYPLQKLGQRLIREGVMLPRCALCGCEEFRITDKKYPLILTQKNNDEHDYRIENLEFLCYNCYFLTVGNFDKTLLKNMKG